MTRRAFSHDHLLKCIICSQPTLDADHQPLYSRHWAVCSEKCHDELKARIAAAMKERHANLLGKSLVLDPAVGDEYSIARSSARMHVSDEITWPLRLSVAQFYVEQLDLDVDPAHLLILTQQSPGSNTQDVCVDGKMYTAYNGGYVTEIVYQNGTRATPENHYGYYYERIPTGWQEMRPADDPWERKFHPDAKLKPPQFGETSGTTAISIPEHGTYAVAQTADPVDARKTALEIYHDLAQQYESKESPVFSPVNVPGETYGDGYFPPYVCLVKYDDSEHPGGLLGDTVCWWPALQDPPVIHDSERSTPAMLQQQIAALCTALCDNPDDARAIAETTGATCEIKTADKAHVKIWLNAHQDRLCEFGQIEVGEFFVSGYYSKDRIQICQKVPEGTWIDWPLANWINTKTGGRGSCGPASPAISVPAPLDPQFEGWTDAQAAARVWKIPARTIQHACRRGNVEAEQKGHRWTFTLRAFLAWLHDRPKPGPKRRADG